MKKLWGFAIAAGLFIAASMSYAVNLSLYSGAGAACNEPSQIQACINDLIVNKINPQVQLPAGSPRNFLDNGAFAVQQYGTGIITCAINGAATTVAAYVDRWGCDTNVAVGAGRQQIITSSPTPPQGFPASLKVYRNSGALTQPVCTMQEIPSTEATYLAGQAVTLSFNAQALAGLNADNGNVINAYIFYGTGTDEGLGTWTASPAITPAWTGINSSLTQAFTITTAWVKYSYTATIPSTAREVAVAFCFTPTATGAGVTDGFAITGIQLEIGTTATAFEFRKVDDELRRAQRFYYTIAEGAAATVRGFGHVTTAGAGDGAGRLQWLIPFPVTMFKAPTMSYTAGFAGFTTTAETAATNCSALAADATLGTLAASTTMALAQCSLTSSTIAVGLSMTVVDNGGSGAVKAWADF